MERLAHTITVRFGYDCNYLSMLLNLFQTQHSILGGVA